MPKFMLTTIVCGTYKIRKTKKDCTSWYAPVPGPSPLHSPFTGLSLALVSLSNLTTRVTVSEATQSCDHACCSVNRRDRFTPYAIVQPAFFWQVIRVQQQKSFL